MQRGGDVVSLRCLIVMVTVLTWQPLHHGHALPRFELALVTYKAL